MNKIFDEKTIQKLEKEEFNVEIQTVFEKCNDDCNSDCFYSTVNGVDYCTPTWNPFA